MTVTVLRAVRGRKEFDPDTVRIEPEEVTTLVPQVPASAPLDNPPQGQHHAVRAHPQSLADPPVCPTPTAQPDDQRVTLGA